MTSAATQATPETERRDALVERLFNATIASFELGCVYLGHRLGLYAAVAERGPLTPRRAGRSGRHPRALRPRVARAAGGGRDPRRARTRPRPPTSAASPARRPRRGPARRGQPQLRGAVRPLPRGLCAAARTAAGGVPLGRGRAVREYGEELHEAQGAFTRPLFSQPARQGVAAGGHRRSTSGSGRTRRRGSPTSRAATATRASRSRGPTRRCTVDGIDLDEASIERRAGGARRERGRPRIESRFTRRDGADPGLAGRYDLVTILESLHDMSRPVDVSRAPCAQCWPKAARSSSATSSSETRFTAPGGRARAVLLRRAASSTACRSGWSARTRPGPAP